MKNLRDLHRFPIVKSCLTSINQTWNFQMVLAKTLFGKCENITTVSKEELFIIFCVLQSKPVNAATFMLASLDRIAKKTHRTILVEGLATMIASVIGLEPHSPT